MSEEGLGIGAALRAAREEKGWTVNDVSSRLRLMTRQIEAIEAEDFSRLGQPVFARGFVRNYAKLLGLDPDELLDQMTRVKLPQVQHTESLPFTPSQEFWKSPWVLGGIAAVVLAVAVPLSLYWWLTSDEEEVRHQATAEQAAPPPPPPPAPVLDGQDAASMPVQPPAQAPLVPQADPAVASAQPQVAAQPLPETAAPATGLRLQFDDISWVQVRDVSGRIVHSGLNPAGSSVDIEGQAPFYLVVGNAEKVHVTYRGRSIDLKPFTSVDVARLTLNP
jgi:cytoskeleton protein RodZ